jgi:hypothetical protein
MGEEPNAFARLVLLIWPLIVLASMKRARRPTVVATGLFLAGFLLLPEQTFWKLPGLPEFGKQSIVPISVLAGLYAFHRRAYRGRFSLDAFSGLALALIVVGGFVTGASNGDALRWGVTLLPAISAYDGFHMVLEDLLTFFVPFFLARVLFRTRDELLVLFRGLVVAALWMSGVALFEMRMSPQLHTWVYGFIPIDSWEQVVRAGGYRPLGFTRHGLAFVLYFFSATLAAVALRRARSSEGKRAVGVWVAPFLLVVTVAFGSLGATVYTVVGVLLLKLTPARFQLALALAAGLFAVSFPYQRWHDTFPTERFVENARANADEFRAQSLEFRFMNEDLLLERVKERWIVGWGEYGRANVFDTYDGRRVTVRDGAWIIQFGDRGLIGLIWLFGVLVVPLLLYGFAAVSRARPEHRRDLAALAVLLAIATLDLLPNGAFHPLAFVFAGAFLGQALALRERTRARVAAPLRARAVALAPAT